MAEKLADQPDNTAEKLADQPEKVAEFEFTGEQAQLRDAVRKFSANNFGEAKARTQMESEPRFDRQLWRRLGSELGVLGLSVPEAAGGVGGTLVDQAIAVEELGAALATGPLFGTVFLAVPALVAAPAGPVRDELLGALVEGTRTAAFAVPDRAGAFDAAAVTVSGTEALTGTVERVVDADAADELLVAATGPAGVALAASIAQALASTAFARIANDTIQVHGGIGFTWEHQAHLYFKRATTDSALLGSAEAHRNRVAELVLDTAPADRPPRVATG